jgi:DNA topoisomerase IA
MKSSASALLFSAAIVSTLSCSSLAAACDEPAVPAIPNAETTVTAEMVKAQNDMKLYMAEAEKYLACVRNDAKHNKMVSRMEQVAEDFNQAVRAFKERMSKA